MLTWYRTCTLQSKQQSRAKETVYTVHHFNYSDVKKFTEKTGDNEKRTKKYLE